MASSSPFDNRFAQMLVLLVVLGAAAFITGLWAIGGAVIGIAFALYSHSLAPIGIGALIGAGIGLAISLWKFLSGFIPTLIRKVRA